MSTEQVRKEKYGDEYSDVSHVACHYMEAAIEANIVLTILKIVSESSKAMTFCYDEPEVNRRPAL